MGIVGRCIPDHLLPLYPDPMVSFLVVSLPCAGYIYKPGDLRPGPSFNCRFQTFVQHLFSYQNQFYFGTMTTTESGSALCPLNDFLQHEYDYIVVGCGTAGLCIAARLTENPDVKVGMLEAGSNRIDDPQVYTPSLYPTLIGRENHDWCFETVPRESANGKRYSMPRGKLLGGSSGINYLVSYTQRC